ncbi:MAG: 2,4-dihydroxyhept-2-ene-1,7-dioic acid aldolase [Deltaproteobacteria bacterium]|nr:2,4-dihydroxyhept-2-ene-1,7-dioic acid aldolase [Deltaproteobacteria bacterium]
MDVRFRERIRARERLLGTLVSLDAPEIAELMRIVGFDWLFLDGEHTPLEAPSLQRLLQAAGPDLPCLIRVPAAAEAPVKKALDIGAAGVIVPMVNTAEDAEHVVRLARYAPRGTRGVGLGRAHGYGLRFRDYLEKANEGVSVVIQAEHALAVEQMEAIVRVDGVDAVLVGPFDLSASLGRPGEVEHPEVVAAIERITTVCRGAGMPLGIFGTDARAVRPYMERGYTLIVAGVDTMLLGDAARRLLEELRSPA